MNAWRKRFGTLESVDVRRLRHLEHENSRLKKLVAELEPNRIDGQKQLVPASKP